MASFTLTIPDPQLDRVAEAFGWGVSIGPPTLPGETRNQFIKRCVLAQIKSLVRTHEETKLRSTIVAPALDAT